MRCEITIKVGGEILEHEYIICETSAPKAYDYGGTIVIEDAAEGLRNDTRLIAIPVEQYEMQRDRNASGMHFTKPQGQGIDDARILGWNADAVIDNLMQKLEGD